MGSSLGSRRWHGGDHFARLPAVHDDLRGPRRFSASRLAEIQAAFLARSDRLRILATSWIGASAAIGAGLRFLQHHRKSYAIGANRLLRKLERRRRSGCVVLLFPGGPGPPPLPERGGAHCPFAPQEPGQ